jgi:hypothetical protein
MINKKFYVTPTSYYFDSTLDLSEVTAEGVKVFDSASEAEKHLVSSHGLHSTEICEPFTLKKGHYVCDRGMSNPFNGDAATFLVNFEM